MIENEKANIVEDELMNGLNTAFIDNKNMSNLAYRPQFIYNDYNEKKKVFSAIEDELENCESFIFSVAFITQGGIAPFLQIFKELKDKGIKGKILTTNYQNFTDPIALKKLQELGNIEVRMYFTLEQKEDFHTKGYLFKNKDTYRYIIGSSNLTQSALMKNKEWNTKIISKKEGEFSGAVLHEFKKMWRAARKYEEFIDTYSQMYEMAKKQKKIAMSDEVVSYETYTLRPNEMQRQFCEKLKAYQADGEKKALLISATGTGKTFASAFGVREALKSTKKTLFLVHREQILKQAKRSYGRVFGNKHKMVIFSGNSKDIETVKEADFVFAMVGMLSKDTYLQQFEKNELENIIIDEVHHAAAGSYQKIMNYFTPQFILGMTATPDRMDGQNIYKIFDYNIALDIRLQHAMEYDLLCPFHYFGITDLEVNGNTVDDGNLDEFNRLHLDERVKHIVTQMQYYGYSGERVKGLIFCKNLEEAGMISEKMKQINKPDGTFYNTIKLDGSTKEEEREEAIDRLISDSREDKLDYILTCGIFNEGVDIPEINQVIMLRPTESSIIFIQQLGRGLRKTSDKEYVVILDFIGNYQKSYLIPKALSGDRSGSKENLRNYVAEGTRLLPGCSSIHFEKIIKERIYQNIDVSNLNKLEDIKFEYKCLKNKLGRIPTYYDFDEQESIDVSCIFKNENTRSYHQFLKKYETNYAYKDSLNEVQEEMLQCISQKIADGKRVDELELLKRIVTYSIININNYQNDLRKNYQVACNTDKLVNIIKVLTNDFLPQETQKKKYSRSVFIEKNDMEIEISGEFKRELRNDIFKKLVQELLDYGIFRYNKYIMKNRYLSTDFVLYNKYNKSDVCRLLNWKQNINPQNIGGYFYDEATKTLPVYITYKKSEEIAETQKYEDRFVGNNMFISISKAGRGLAGERRKESSREASYFYDKDTQIYLFLQKDKKETEYYFMGRLYTIGEPIEVFRKETMDTVLEFHYKFETPVREDLYDYFTNEVVVNENN